MSAHEGTLPPACEDMPEVGAEAEAAGGAGVLSAYIWPLCVAL